MVDSQSLFDHEGPWTEATYLALKHDGRVEVVDGTLIIGPGPHPRRIRAIEHLREAVASALPDGLVVRGPVPLRLGPDCLLVPDLIVTAAPSSDGTSRFSAGRSAMRRRGAGVSGVLRGVLGSAIAASPAGWDMILPQPPAARPVPANDIRQAPPAR